MQPLESNEIIQPSPFKQYLEERLYRYTDTVCEQEFEIRKLDIEQHLDLFHHWHNQPYVYKFWELNQSKSELRKYLERLTKQAYIEPCIGYINQTPCAYFEIYWAFFDRIAPFCDATLYDRGYHLLIGEKQYLGRHNTTLWLKLVNDFIFKDEAKTKRIVGEPRADNKGLMKYLSQTGFVKTKEFDFPHKRAALIECHRERFYRDFTL